MEEMIENTAKSLNNCQICEKIKKDFEKCNSDGESCGTSRSGSVKDEPSVSVKSSNASNSSKAFSNSENNYGSSFSLSIQNRTQSRISNTSTTSSKLSLPKNRTFSTDRLREIDRRNAMLVDKILYHSTRPNKHVFVEKQPVRKITSSEINRKRLQEKISRENEILLKKIQSVKPCVKYKK